MTFEPTVALTAYARVTYFGLIEILARYVRAETF